MKVKPVQYKDLDKIHELEEETFGGTSFSKELFEKLYRWHLLFLKLEKGYFRKKIIGFLIMVKDKRQRANLINFLIDADYRKKGWGGFLLDHALTRIKNNHSKINIIILNVKVDNSAAIRLYKKFGFTIIDKIDDYYHTGESAYVMKLTLSKNGISKLSQ
jgi:ribosomal-protein-alanine N-acetyltransferase